MDNKMILRFIYFELLTRHYKFGQCYNILPHQKNLTFMQCFHYALLCDQKQKESTDYRTFKNFRTFCRSRINHLIIKENTDMSKNKNFKAF